MVEAGIESGKILRVRGANRIAGARARSKVQHPAEESGSQRLGKLELGKAVKA